MSGSEGLTKTQTKQAQEATQNTAKTSGKGWSATALCIAQIVEIHWEELRCTLEILHGNGADTRALTGVELLMPSMGNRHFMGGIPEIGDQCVIGWFASDTKAGTSGKTPAILAWWPNVPWIKHDWIMTQGFTPSENIMENNKNRQIVQNFYHRIRHKLRHFSPGNIGASSSQGSDMVLDESVLLSNRRSNEILIRDQDQAIVMRSLQQFHAMSGARIYGGMVQRDARTLPKEMFSDGIKWDASIQIDTKGVPYNPINGGDLFESPLETGELQPHPVFQRDEYTDFGVDIKGERKNFKGKLPVYLDPYVFLYNAGLVSEDYFDDTQMAGTTYGGKSILRVVQDDISPNSKAFTEYRIEMNHTTDGQLPVTEQTDGFDSDRASVKPEESRDPPFIEWVLGTPTGNDAFSAKGKTQYGIPFVPTRESLEIATDETPFSDHSATLLRITPLVRGVSDSFVSFTKGGKLKAKISSPDEDSFEARVEGGAFLDVNNDLFIQSSTLSTNITESVNVSTGTINLTASGSQAGGNLDGDEPNVSVIVKGNKRVSIQSDTAVSFKAPIVDFSQVGQLRLSSSEQLEFNSGASMNTTANTIKQSSMGKFEQVCGGPVDGLPIGGPARSVIITESIATGSAGTPSDSYTNAFGGKTELYIGPATNTRTMTTATETTTIGAGAKTEVVAGVSTITDPTGHKFIAPAGALVATSGTVCSLVATTVSIRGNTAVVISGPSVTLASTGGALGPILCGSDLHPITGVPMLLTVAPRGQNLAISI